MTSCTSPQANVLVSQRAFRNALGPGCGAGSPTKKKGSGLCPGEVLGLTSPKPRWQEVVEPPADPPQKGVALLKPTKGEAMLGSK